MLKTTQLSGGQEEAFAEWAAAEHRSVSQHLAWLVTEALKAHVSPAQEAKVQ